MLKAISTALLHRPAIPVVLAVAALAIGLPPAGEAWAHGAGPEGEQADAEALLQAIIGSVMVAATAGYGWGWRRLVRRLGREPVAAGVLAPVFFLAGQTVLGIALLSPLAESGLFTAHMVQHVLLVGIAPPFLLLGRPDLFTPYALPAATRRALFRAPVVRVGLAGLRLAAQPLPAAFLHGAALWVWHAPSLFEAAERSNWLHAMEHLSFFGTALLFWQGIVRAETPKAALAGAAGALATLVHSGFLAAILVFSPAVLYPEATAHARSWGLTPLEDQQLAGVVMWVPAGIVYLLAGLLLAARAIAPRPAARVQTSAMRFE